MPENAPNTHSSHTLRAAAGRRYSLAGVILLLSLGACNITDPVGDGGGGGGTSNLGSCVNMTVLNLGDYGHCIEFNSPTTAAGGAALCDSLGGTVSTSVCAKGSLSGECSRLAGVSNHSGYHLVFYTSYFYAGSCPGDLTSPYLCGNDPEDPPTCH